MTAGRKIRENDVVRTLVDLQSLWEQRPVPAGTMGTVAEIHDDGGVIADISFRPQTQADDGEHDQVVLAEGQYEAIQPGG